MKRAPLWLFDLDNTLHDAAYALFPAIDNNMTEFIARVLAAESGDVSTANAIRIKYWQCYGATLLGMIKHHAVRAEDFLRDAHTFDDMTSMIRVERGLRSLFHRLPGKKILLTNAPKHYALTVVRHMGLHRHFKKHIAIESMRVHGQWRPKPSKSLLRSILAREKKRARDCIVVEDTRAVLKSAKAVGMRTMWVTGYHPYVSGCPHYVDVKLKSVRQLHKRIF